MTRNHCTADPEAFRCRILRAGTGTLRKRPNLSHFFSSEITSWLLQLRSRRTSSTGSGDGQDDRLERADVIDPDGVEKHGDEMSGMGEIGENAPSEANFDETMSIVEAQESIQVTANSGALSGLDNGAAQPGEDSTPEQGKAPGSASESGTIRAEPPPVTTTRPPRLAHVRGSPTTLTRRASEGSYRTDTPAPDSIAGTLAGAVGLAWEACRRRSRSGRRGDYDAKRRGGRWRGWSKTS